MALISTIVIGVLLAIGLLNGLRRGGIKEGMALVGVLLGALLVEYWASRWGASLSQRIGMKQQTLTWLIALALLIGTALLSGYGSGLLLRRNGMKGGERFSGALLGLLNMGLLISLTLRYTQQLYFNEADPAKPVTSWIRSGILSRYLLNYIGYVLIGVALALAISALITATIRVSRRLTRPAPLPKQPAPAARPSQPASPPPAKPAEPSTSYGAAQPQTKTPVGQRESFIEPPRTGQ